MSGCYVTWGFDHELTKGSQVHSFCNSHGLRQKDRVKEAEEGQDTTPHKRYKDQEGAGTTTAKDQYSTESHYNKATKINVLHDY